MTASTTNIERSAPAIRAALAEVSPVECAQFEAEFTESLARASAEFDLAPAEAVLDRWWGIVRIIPTRVAVMHVILSQPALARGITIYDKDIALAVRCRFWQEKSGTERARCSRDFPLCHIDIVAGTICNLRDEPVGMPGGRMCADHYIHRQVTIDSRQAVV
jgi:hypothetical protein